jgi:hypothetical protein
VTRNEPRRPACSRRRGRDLSYALLSRSLGRWWVGMPAAMLMLGYLVGADGRGWVSTGIHSEIVKTTAELTLALMLVHDAVRIK